MVEIGNLKRVYDETEIEEFESEFVDTAILCVDCDESFVWTIGEQTFFRDKGLVNPPKRCKTCKQAKNKRLSDIQRAQETGVKQKVEVSVNCAKCDTRTTVPFYPSQGRPVYCRSCFLDMNPAVLSSSNGRE
jgi:CxxC-x17-CxxC domain-containing protein